MTTQRQVQVRISAQGGGQLKAELKDIGVVGSRAFKQVGDSARANTSQVQNAAYQVGDFFVQVGGGTDPMRAAAQQLPQLLGGLGMFGAIAGAAVAAAVPLAGMFFNMGEKAIPAEERVKALAEAVSALDAATRAASADPMDLLDRFGSSGVEQAKEALEIERQLAKARAEQALSVASTSFGENFGVTQGRKDEIKEIDDIMERIRAAGGMIEFEDLSQIVERLNTTHDQALNIAEAMLVVNDSVDQLSDAFGLSAEQASVVADLMEAVGDADGPKQQAAAMGELRDYIYEATEGNKGLTEEAIKFLENLTEAEVTALLLAKIDYASGIGAGADEAGRLADNMAAAAAANAWLAERSFEQQPGIQAMIKYGGRGTTDSRAIEDGFGEEIKIATSGSGRGRASGAGRRGGRGGGGTDPLTKEAEKWFNATRTAAEKYAEELAELDKLQAAAKISADTYSRGLAQIGEKYLDIGDASEFWKDVNADLKDEILDLGVYGEASFDGIRDSIKRAAWEAALFKTGPLASMFGGTGKGGGLGNILSGLLSFEGGGYTGSGARSGGMDGRGGYLAMLHPQETVVDHRKGGGMASTTQVEVLPSKYFDVRVAQVSTAFDQQAARTQRRAMPSAMRDAQARGLK